MRVHVAGGNITLDGPVPDANEKSAIEDAAGARFGNDNVLSNLAVLATADSAGWLAKAMDRAAAQGRGLRRDRHRRHEDHPRR